MVSQGISNSGIPRPHVTQYEGQYVIDVWQTFIDDYNMITNEHKCEVDHHISPHKLLLKLLDLSIYQDSTHVPIFNKNKNNVKLKQSCCDV